MLTYVSGAPLPRRALNGAPLSVVAIVPGRRRPLRRRHRGHPRGAADRPPHRRSRSRRLRLGPDPPHPQGHPAEGPGHPRLRRQAGLHPQPDLLRRNGDRRRRSGAGGADVFSSADDAAPPARRASRPPTAPASASSPAWRCASRAARRRGAFPALRIDLPPAARRRQPAPLRPALPPLGVHRTGPLPHDLHPRAVRRRARLRRTLPQGRRSTATSRSGRRCSTSP